MKKYEEILGIKATEAFEPFGPDAPSTNTFELLQSASNFWKVVSGDEKLAAGSRAASIQHIKGYQVP